jgi:hypothetical protein
MGLSMAAFVLLHWGPSTAPAQPASPLLCPRQPMLLLPLPLHPHTPPPPPRVLNTTPFFYPHTHTHPRPVTSPAWPTTPTFSSQMQATLMACAASRALTSTGEPFGPAARSNSPARCVVLCVWVWGVVPCVLLLAACFLGCTFTH